MKDKKSLIITIFSIIIITIIVIVGLNISKTKKETQNNIKIIKSSYQMLSTDIKEYNEIRKNYIDMSNNLLLETYYDSHKEYISLLTKYNNVIEKIDSSISNISLRCNTLYNDTETNTICNNYKSLYEKIINLYVTDLTNYNNNITKYNEYKNDNIELFTMIHKDYIDYNNDGIYEGRDIDEEN